MAFTLQMSFNEVSMYLTEVWLHVVLHIAETPRVGIIMGSDSDLPVMKDAAQILDMFGVAYEVKEIELGINHFVLTSLHF